MPLHIMETDLALLLACMPMVEQCSREGSVGTSTCAESTQRRAVQTLPKPSVHSFIHPALPPVCRSSVNFQRKMPFFTAKREAVKGHFCRLKTPTAQRQLLSPCRRSIPHPEGAVLPISRARS